MLAPLCQLLLRQRARHCTEAFWSGEEWVFLSTPVEIVQATKTYPLIARTK